MHFSFRTVAGARTETVPEVILREEQNILFKEEMYNERTFN